MIMPLLARAKRRAGEALGSRLVIADAAETRLCAWLSVSTLVGLLAFTGSSHFSVMARAETGVHAALRAALASRIRAR